MCAAVSECKSQVAGVWVDRGKAQPALAAVPPQNDRLVPGVYPNINVFNTRDVLIAFWAASRVYPGLLGFHENVQIYHALLWCSEEWVVESGLGL